jgi:hypothetical protein
VGILFRFSLPPSSNLGSAIDGDGVDCYSGIDARWERR